MKPARTCSAIAGVAMLLLTGFASAQGDALALPRIAGLDTAQITVSGVSAGAAMAVQLGVAYSSRVAGVGAIAGPPYLCAEGSLRKALFECLIVVRATMDRWTSFAPAGAGCAPPAGKPLAVQAMIDGAAALAGRAAIDPLTGLARQKVWEFRGRCDEIVGSNASTAQAAFYRHFGARFQALSQDGVSHTMPTDKPGLGACDGEDKDYVSSCGLDAVGEMLRHILAGTPARSAPASGTWQRFDQAHHIDGDQAASQRLKDIGMAPEGQLFVPELCRSKPCSLHVALHGCVQGIDDAMFDNYVRQSGYAEWASSIGLVVLFPRLTAIMPFQRGLDPLANPAGCWDWWGYTNGESADPLRYASRDAPQMRAIMKMVDALGGK